MPDFGALSDLFGAIGDALSAIGGLSGSAGNLGTGTDKDTFQTLTDAFGSVTGDK